MSNLRLGFEEEVMTVFFKTFSVAGTLKIFWMFSFLLRLIGKTKNGLVVK